MKAAATPITSAIYFGASYRAAQTVHRRFPLSQIVCEKKQFNRDLYDFSRWINAGFKTASDKETLDDLRPAKGALGVSYGFGLIFDKSHIRKFSHGIWNIHPGQLPQFRGRHPVSWALIMGRQELVLTIHSIDDQIDRGMLLAEKSIARDLHDTEVEVLRRMEEALEAEVFDCAVRNYRRGRIKRIGKGTYHASLADKFKSVDPQEFGSVELFNLMKSQSKHGGLVINSKRYTVCTFCHPDYEAHYSGYDLYLCKDGIRVGLK